MQRSESTFRLLTPCWVSAAILAAVLAFATYRAVTQSLTIDESTTFNLYVKDAPHALFALDTYRANHHVLHSIAAWMSVSLFGFAEWSLRLPALLGGLVFMFASLRVLRRLVGDSWLLPLSCAAIWLNPIVLDHLVKARGYGMALGFSTLALHGLMRWRSSGEASTRKLGRVSLWIGLAVASNMVFAVWGGALLLATWFVSMCLHDRWRPIHFLVAVLPGALLAGAIVGVPLMKMQNLRYGATSWSECLRSLVDSTLHHSSESWSEGVLMALGGGVLLLLALAAIVNRKTLADGRLICLFALISACLAYAVARLFVSELRLPLHRTGLSLIVGMTFTMAAFARPPVDRSSAGQGQWCTRALTAVLLVLVFSHCSELSASRFRSGGHDASARAVFDKLHELHEESDRTRPLSVGVFGWFYDSTLNAYRHMDSAEWLLPVKREGLIPSMDHDFYVVADEVWHRARPFSEVIERYPGAQTRLVRWSR